MDGDALKWQGSRQGPDRTMTPSNRFLIYLYWGSLGKDTLPNEGTKVDGFQGSEDPVASPRFWISFHQVSKWMLYSTSDLAVYHQIQQASGPIAHSLVWVSGFPCHSREAWGGACFPCGEYSERRQKLKPSVASLWTSGNCKTLAGKAIKVHLFSTSDLKEGHALCDLNVLSTWHPSTLTSALWDRTNSWKTKAEV